jgi:hypothetical protein
MPGAALLASLALLAVQSPLAAQPADARLAEADRLVAERNVAAALARYESIIADQPAHYDALCRASAAATDLGEFHTDAKERTALYQRARDYAERAIEANPAGAEGHFALSRAVGRVALSAGVRERVRLATAVREHALHTLARDSTHDGALHILGVWNAEVMRLNGFQRTMARAFLGGKVLAEANWADAVRYLERSVALAPHRIVHHLDLGRVYLDVKRRDDAREQFELVARAPIAEYNDGNYKRLAADALRGIK